MTEEDNGKLGLGERSSSPSANSSTANVSTSTTALASSSSSGKEPSSPDGAKTKEDSKPRLDGRNIVFKTRIVNEYLVCSLCMGYFREATTTCECLHTFCKSCIYKYFQTSADCPRCGTNLGPNPFERIRFDRTLTEIVHKLFPQVIAKDIENERAFYLARGMQVSAPLDKSRSSGVDGSTFETPPKRQKVVSKVVSFQLTPHESDDPDEEGLRELERPYISTREPHVLSTLHLKKYVKLKLNLSSTTELEILWKGTVLSNEQTLDQILRQGYKGADIPELTYRRRKGTST